MDDDDGNRTGCPEALVDPFSTPILEFYARLGLGHAGKDIDDKGRTMRGRAAVGMLK